MTSSKFAFGLVAALTAMALAGAAQAAQSCVVPRNVTPAPAESPPADQIHTDVPVAAYLLSLIWSPEACRAGAKESDRAIQCQANSFGFTVHGLWPNGPDKVHPRYCRPSGPLSVATVKANLCMTPSPWLLQHEWQAHGTCAWETPEAYFTKARSVRAGLNVPVLKPNAAGAMTAGQVRDAFLKRNRGMVRDGLDVQVDKGNRLVEVRVCYDLNFKLAPCIGTKGTPDGVTIRVTPKR